jgi:hypothetical protein
MVDNSELIITFGTRELIKDKDYLRQTMQAGANCLSHG